jgi:polysaccharide export outer membrane protein
MFKRLALAIFLTGLIGLVSCGGYSPSVKTIATQQQSNSAVSTSNDSYIIGPGDILSVNVWREPELSKQVSVRLDGKMSLPLVNEIEAAGLTCAELRNKLTKKYGDYVDVPEVAVTLVESHSKKIYLLGNINQPGEYLLQKNMTVVQAISLAGGLGEWADASDIKLIRKIKGTQKTFRVDYDAIVSGKDLSQNVQLEPDDTIFVP